MPLHATTVSPDQGRVAQRVDGAPRPVPRVGAVDDGAELEAEALAELVTRSLAADGAPRPLAGAGRIRRTTRPMATTVAPPTGRLGPIRRAPARLLAPDDDGKALAPTNALEEYVDQLPKGLRLMVERLLAAVAAGKLVITADQGRLLIKLFAALATELAGVVAGPEVEAKGEPLPGGMISISLVVSHVVRTDVQPFVGGVDMFVPGQWLAQNVPELFAGTDLPAPAQGPAQLGGPDGRADEERKKKEEEDRKREEERKTKEEEDRKREEERKQKEEAERKRKEEEEERQRQEEERKKKEEAERKQAEEDKKYDDRKVKPEVFQYRAKLVLARAEAIKKSLKKEDPFFNSKIKAAETAVSTTMTKNKGKPDMTNGPSAAAAIEALKALEAMFDKVGVDLLEPERKKLGERAEAMLAEAKKLPKLATTPAATQLAKELVSSATKVKNDAKHESVKTANDISVQATKVAGLEGDINQALKDIPLMHVAEGSSGERQQQLGQLRSELDEPQILDLMPKMGAAPSMKRAEILIDIVREAKRAPAFQIACLTTLLPAVPATCPLANLPKVIVLCDALGFAPAVCVQHYIVLDPVAAAVSRPDLAWFKAMSWPNFVTLSAIPVQTLATFVTKVTREAADRLLTHNVPVAAMQHYLTTKVDILNYFCGIPDDAWAHVTAKIKANEGSKQLSGGHDEARYTAYVAKKLASTARPWTRVAADHTLATSGSIKKVRYRLRDFDGKDYVGTKTLIAGLETNEAAWRVLAEQAAWNALANQQVNAEDWTGSDGTRNWTGYHNKKGLITTVYPDI